MTPTIAQVNGNGHKAVADSCLLSESPFTGTIRSFPGWNETVAFDPDLDKESRQEQRDVPFVGPPVDIEREGRPSRLVTIGDLDIPSDEISGSVPGDRRWISRLPQEQATQPKPSVSYVKVVRGHYVEPIIESLRLIKDHAGTPDCTPYASRIFRMVDQMVVHSPRDPFIEILLALYDAMAWDSNWLRYESEQFNAALEILEESASRYPLRPDAVEKAIMRLEKAGFDTTPCPAGPFSEE